MAESKLKVVICPGMHSPALTENFMNGLRSLQDTRQGSLQAEGLHYLEQSVTFPIEKLPAYSPLHLLEFLAPLSGDPLLFIAFSAGVVGAIGAARLWQKRGGTVKALIALDGWGVPLEANFPIHRASHDYFTHWSSALLGNGLDSFYADPGVGHLDLWRSPQTISGHWIKSTQSGELLKKDAPPLPNASIPVTLATFITALCQKYEAETQADTGS
ncbi:hypothetical protein [Phormidesmis sp. 146-33]